MNQPLPLMDCLAGGHEPVQNKATQRTVVSHAVQPRGVQMSTEGFIKKDLEKKKKKRRRT